MMVDANAAEALDLHQLHSDLQALEGHLLLFMQGREPAGTDAEAVDALTD